ncbi:MAG: Stp1/IreP family PP2C-type Ser/Thr phosphatase [Thermoanaerobaculia bacterium]|nr:Stp1/IreP family PP2C-type Ser/Thr phosphatase [Thermoanaerobaculia bacterium]
MTEKPEDQTRTIEESSSESRFDIEIALRSDVGSVRTDNQDFAITSTEAESTREHGHLMVVADGMGGHKGGATASMLAATTIKKSYFESEGDDVPGALREAIEKANARIHEEATENDELEGMGTTTSAMVIRDGKSWIGHVGDSRIYRIRNGAIEQMTEDHSLVATMVKEGLLTSEEAEIHPRRNVLQRSMGVSAEVEIDISGPIDLEPGDRFVLCSDGLHGLVTGDEIAEVAGSGDINAAADRFIELAMERGAHDNVTVIIAAVEEDGESSAEAGRDEAVGGSAPKADEPDDEVAGSSPEPSIGARGCLLRTLLVVFGLLAVVGSFFLLVAGDLFVSWFNN